MSVVRGNATISQRMRALQKRNLQPDGTREGTRRCLIRSVEGDPVSSILKQLQAAIIAIDTLATTPGAHARDRLSALRQLATRIDSTTQRLANELSRDRNPNPVSQQGGD